VRKDVVDGYISARAAREIYGVELDGDGNVDAGASRERRSSIRERRIGRAPERDITSDASPFVPLRIVERRWRCGLCGVDLGDAEDNWRMSAVVCEREISERFEELGLAVRRREQFEPVVLRENFCPGCGSSLAVDVTLEGHELVPAPRPGVADPYPSEEPAAVA
jgi:ribosomal protein S27AE